MYFSFIKFCIFLLLTILCIQGIYALISNKMGNSCSNNMVIGCDDVFAMRISLINKVYETSRLNAEAWLDLTVVVVMMIGFHFHRKNMRIIALEVDKATISPPDFTLIVRRVDPNVTDEELRQFFETAIPNRTTPVAAINRSYDIAEIMKDVRKNQTLVRKMKAAMKRADAEKAKAEKANSEAERSRAKDMEASARAEIESLQRSIKEVEARIEKADEEETALGSIAFVSFVYEKDAQDVQEHLMGTPFRQFLGSIMGYPKAVFNQRLRGSFMPVAEASEPTDIYWEHLSYPNKIKLRRRLATLFLTTLLIAACFAALIGISVGQNELMESTLHIEYPNVVRGLGYLASIVIAIINFILQLLIRKMATYELRSTYTGFFVSISEKLAISTFINTAFTTFFAKAIVYSARGESGFYSYEIYFAEGAVIGNMFMVFITNAFLSPVLTFFDTAWFLKLYSRYSQKKLKEKSKLTQAEANILFEGVNVDMATKYAALLKTMLLTSFYAPVSPIATVFAIAGLILVYWSDKYLFLRRMAMPKQMGRELALSMTELLEWSALFFALGSLSWFHIVGGGDFPSVQHPIATGIAVGLTFLNLCLPQERFNRYIFKIEDRDVGAISYWDALLDKFNTTYGLENPVTKDDEIEFIEFARARRERERREQKKQALASLNISASPILDQSDVNLIQHPKEPVEQMNEQNQSSPLLPMSFLHKNLRIGDALIHQVVQGDQNSQYHDLLIAKNDEVHIEIKEQGTASIDKPEDQGVQGDAHNREQASHPNMQGEATKIEEVKRNEEAPKKGPVKKKKGFVKNLKEYADHKADIKQLGSAQAQQLHEHTVEVSKPQHTELVQKMVGCGTMVEKSGSVFMSNGEGNNANNSENINTVLAEEVDPNQIIVDQTSGLSTSRIGKTVLDLDISELKTRMGKYTSSYRFGGSNSQKQIEQCLDSLQQFIEAFVPLQGVIATESPNKNNSHDEEEPELPDVLKIESSRLNVIHQSCEAFLAAVIELLPENQMNEEQNLELLSKAVSALDLKTSIQDSFDMNAIEKIQKLKTAISALNLQVQEDMTSLGLLYANKNFTHTVEIKEDLLAQKPEFKELPDATFEKICAIVGIGNLSRKFSRDLGSLLAVQGLNPATFEDERNQQEEMNQRSANTRILAFDPALIRDVPIKIMNEGLDSMKNSVKRIHQAHRSIEVHQLTLQSSFQEATLTNEVRAHLENDIRGFNELNLKLRGLENHLLNLLQIDSVGQKMAEEEEEKLLEEEKRMTETSEAPENVEQKKHLARLLAAINLFNLTIGTETEKDISAPLLNSKLRQVSSMKRELSKIFTIIDQILSTHELSKKCTGAKDFQTVMMELEQSQVARVHPKNWLSVLCEIILIRNYLRKYDGEQCRLFTLQGINMRKLHLPNLKLVDYFVDKREIIPKLIEATHETEQLGHQDDENASRLKEIGKTFALLQGNLIDVLGYHGKDGKEHLLQENKLNENLGNRDSVQGNPLSKVIQQFDPQNSSAAGEDNKLKEVPENIVLEQLGPLALSALKGKTQEKEALIEKMKQLKVEGNDESFNEHQKIFGLGQTESQNGFSELFDAASADPEKQKKIKQVLDQLKEQKAKIESVLQDFGVSELALEDNGDEEAIKKQLVENNIELASQPHKLQQIGNCLVAKFTMANLEKDIENSLGQHADEGAKIENQNQQQKPNSQSQL